MPIVDPHLHIFGSANDRQYFRIDDYAEELTRGHRILKTVYMEAYRSGWRTTGPEHLRSVGEVESIASRTREPITTAYGHCEFAAGIVAHVDLTLGVRVVETLDALVEAGEGRLRGVRQVAAYDDGLVGSFIKELPPVRLMQNANFLDGFSKLQGYGLSFDVWIYHHQLDELTWLVDKFPGVTFILNHLGGLIGVGPYGKNRAESMKGWELSLRRLAERTNVFVKVGGMGMPVFGHNFEHKARPATSSEMATAWQPLIDICVSAFGTRRCMFESNFPVDRQSGGYTEIWNALKKATKAMSPGERHEMFYESACRAYRL